MGAAPFNKHTTEHYQYVNYGVTGEPVHERLVLRWVERDIYVVATPDYDVFVEDMAEVQGKKVVTGHAHKDGARPAVPSGLGSAHGKPVYRFAKVIPYARLNTLRKDADDLLHAERRRRGLHNPGTPKGLPDMSHAPQTVDGEVWVLLEGEHFGQEVLPGPRDLAVGAAGVHVLHDQPVLMRRFRTEDVARELRKRAPRPAAPQPVPKREEIVVDDKDMRQHVDRLIQSDVIDKYTIARDVNAGIIMGPPMSEMVTKFAGMPWERME